MRKTLWLSSLLLLVLCIPGPGLAQTGTPAAKPPLKPSDTIKTDKGDLVITFLGHASLMFQWQGKVVHVDPWTMQADYAALPKADLILVTHEHKDHLDLQAIAAIRKPGTVIGASANAAASLPGAVVLRVGDSTELSQVRVDTVFAYNLEHMRSPGVPYHIKGDINGYVLHFGRTRVYVASDTENIPEMAALRGVDVAFLPVSLPFTMAPEMLVDAARRLAPKILYPYHTGDTDMVRVELLLKGLPGVETRIRPMK